MDLLDILRACIKRWYVFLPVVIVTLVLSLGQFQAATPQYTATTSILVVPSKELIIARGAQGMGGSPVTTPFSGGGGASSLAGMLSNALNTVTVRKQLLPEGGVLLTAERDTMNDSEYVAITVVANSEERAAQAVKVVNGGVNQVLADLQTNAGAPQGQLFVAASGGPVDPPRVDYPDRLRGVVGLGLAGTLAAVVLSLIAQALAVGRSRRTTQSSRPARSSRSGARTAAAGNLEWLADADGTPPAVVRDDRSTNRQIDLREAGARSHR